VASVDLGPDMDVADGQGVFLDEPKRLPKRARKRSAAVAAATTAAAAPAADAPPAFLWAGIDEAGRGPVLGPLVIAGVAGADLALFKELGCKDSKLVAPDRRKAIDRALRKAAGVRIEVRSIAPDVLDKERREGRSLNRIEAMRFRDIARSLGAHHVIVDAADTNAARFGRIVRAWLPKGVVVQSEHKADLNHPIVGAASIVAKVARDAAVAQLARLLERRLPMPLGSGYSHDPLTQAFLAAYWKEHRELPEGTRHTWATAKDLVAPRPVALDAFLADAPAPMPADVPALIPPVPAPGRKRGRAATNL
jgi:ribonuclease HII